MPRAVSYTPHDIWEYIKRGLTMVQLFEDLTTAGIIYRGQEFFDKGWMVVGRMIGSGYGGIYFPEDDIIPSSTFTTLLTGYDYSPLIDHDDTTWDSPSLSIDGTNGQTIDLVQIDLGASMDVMLFVRGMAKQILSNLAVTNAVVYTSVDATTWNTVLTIGFGDPYNHVLYLTGIRYVKLGVSVSNTNSATGTATPTVFASIEAYKPYPLDITYEKEITSKGFTTLNMFYDASGEIYAQLYKVRKL